MQTARDLEMDATEAEGAAAAAAASVARVRHLCCIECAVIDRNAGDR